MSGNRTFLRIESFSQKFYVIQLQMLETCQIKDCTIIITILLSRAGISNLFRNVNIDDRLLLLLLGYWGCLLVCLSVSVLQQILKQSYQVLGILNRDVNLRMHGILEIYGKIEHFPGHK